MVGARCAPTSRSSDAFAPGHVTGVFSPDVSHRDPRARGSVGAGLVLELGAHAHAVWNPSGRTQTILHREGRSALPISLEVARRLRGARKGRVEVRIRHELPVGQGFGMSAAGALSVALALGSVFEIPRQHCIEVAHLAELYGRGGLGGVAAILGGGIEVRTRAGVPPWGAVRHSPRRARLFIGVAGRPLPSVGPLADRRFLARVRAAGLPRLKRLGSHPTLERYFHESAEFSAQLDIGSPPLRRFLSEMSENGIRVTQAMFGNAFVAWLDTRETRGHILTEVERRGWRGVELSLARLGASAAGKAF